MNPEQHRLVEPAALTLDNFVDDLGEERDNAQREPEAQGQLDCERQAEPLGEASTDLFAEQLFREHEGNFTPEFGSQSHV